ncbi:MAG: phage tail sheath family protein [Candidatus Accumulibacter sp.]|nr:phage tail sheath family protein [Accumulibacter sp.]
MAATYQTPGVYREDVFVQPATGLPTGIAGFVGLAAVTGAAVPAPILLHRREELVDALPCPPVGYLGAAITGFFANGGRRCYVALVDPAAADRLAALKNALAKLGALSDVDLVAMPDAVLLPDHSAINEVQRAMLSHCAEHGDRLAILDTAPKSSVDSVLDQRQRLTQGLTEPLNGALYHPWLQTGRDQWVPPCGHVAGIFARTDARVGVFKAPANEKVVDALDLEAALDNPLQDRLNPEGVNCLRALPGRGIRVWGARTLNRDPAWRHVNVRRLFLTVGRWIDRNMSWAAFEPNDARLWVRIQRELSPYLTGLWRAGAMQGQTAAEGFYVKCDGETNPPETREVGQVVTEIGLAATAPAEFIVVRIIHRAGPTDTVQPA